MRRSIQVIPAIDLKEGRCVRLVEGRAGSEKVYDEDPVEIAISYQESGANLLHLVDLDGAFSSTGNNLRIIREIVGRLDIQVEVGGGLRTIDDIKRLLFEIGASHAIVGTLAIEEPDLLADAVSLFGESIVVAIDARGLEVRTRGWTRTTGENAADLARTVSDLGVRRIIFTDISRDGKLEGLNLEATAMIARESRTRVTASGGVASLDDIRALARLGQEGVDSVIVGKALYEKRFTLSEAIEVGAHQE